jgi:hypothetical protein
MAGLRPGHPDDEALRRPPRLADRRRAPSPPSFCRWPKPGRFVIRHRPRCFGLFPGSSVVEQPAVNRLVAGSNPARGAKQFNHLNLQRHLTITSRVRQGYASHRTRRQRP